MALARVLRAWIASGVTTSGGAPLCLRRCLRFRGPAPIAARRAVVGVGRLGGPFVMVGSRETGETERQRDREAGRQRDRETGRQRAREPERQRDRGTERQRDRETERKTDREAERQRDRGTYRRRDREAERQIDR